VALADVVREESFEAIEALHQMGVEVAMLTGDSEDVARAVSEELGIDTYFAAEVLPADKDEKIVELQEGGTLVAMVGDGVNDAPALTRADVGIAIGSGTDVAVESADVVLVENDPRDVASLVRLSRKSYRKMQENIVWAAGYNVIALPLAAGLLAPIGVLLSPAVGAVLMSASTIVVAVNAHSCVGPISRIETTIGFPPGHTTANGMVYANACSGLRRLLTEVPSNGTSAGRYSMRRTRVSTHLQCLFCHPSL